MDKETVVDSLLLAKSGRAAEVSVRKRKRKPETAGDGKRNTKIAASGSSESLGASYDLWRG